MCQVLSLHIMTKTIAILGGTFDPIHIGHVQMIKYIVDNDFADEVWVMPSFYSPHKDIDNITSFKDRVNMINLSTADIDKVIISSFEKEYFDKHNEKTYTYEVLSELSRQFMDYKFVFVVGYDSIENIETWHNYKDLLKNFSFYIFDRNDNKLSNISQKNNYISRLVKDLNINFDYKLFDTEICDISSTEIRALLKDIKSNSDLLLKYINEKVLYYIIENKLYGTK